MDNKKIGDKIKQYRKQKKLTQTQLANQINKTLSSIQKYEKGVVNIPYNVIGEIAKALNIPIEYLLFEEKKSDNSDNSDYAGKITERLAVISAELTLLIRDLKNIREGED